MLYALPLTSPPHTMSLLTLYLSWILSSIETSSLFCLPLQDSGREWKMFGLFVGEQWEAFSACHASCTLLCACYRMPLLCLPAFPVSASPASFYDMVCTYLSILSSLFYLLCCCLLAFAFMLVWPPSWPLLLQHGMPVTCQLF